jgi:hypothetical protein
MRVDYPERRRLCRPFIVTSYVAGADGVLTAQMPCSCPARGDPEESRCELAVHHHRHRKTGPQHPLLVVQCRTHGSAFTLYPPAYAPYRRQAVLKLAPDGEPIRSEREVVETDFEGTVFEAALQAKDGQRWARDSDDQVPERWWSTQGRHLRLSSRLVGVADDVAERDRESIAAVLSVSTLALRERCQAKGYRAVGRAVCVVLSWLKGGARRAWQLLVCGHLIGQWGEPLHWDTKRHVLLHSPFLAGGTTSPT